MNKEKIIGIYRYKEDGKDIFCYIVKDEKGRVFPNFTNKLDVIKEKFVSYAKDNGYNKSNLKDMLESDSFDLNCTSYDDVKKKASTLIVQNYSKRKSKEEPVEKQGLLTRLHNKFNNVVDNVKSKFKESKIVKNVKVRRAAIVVLGLTIAIGSIWALKKHSGPTADDSKFVVNDEKDTNKEKESTNPSEEKANGDQNDIIEPTNQVLKNGGGNGISVSAPNITSTPGSVNENEPAFQDPSVSIDDSTNDNSNNPSNDNSYDNVLDEEVPVDNNNDNDFSEVIDTPIEENQNDIILDDKFIGNEGAIDVDVDYTTDENVQSNLPDPNETANTNDGDYNTTQEELINEQKEDVSTGQIEEIPVEQEVTLSNSDIVGKAVDAMERGEDVDIVYNAETGNMHIEEIEVPTVQETNSYTK